HLPRAVAALSGGVGAQLLQTREQNFEVLSQESLPKSRILARLRKLGIGNGRKCGHATIISAEGRGSRRSDRYLSNSRLLLSYTLPGARAERQPP
ncbi:MAG: hypothetical protein WBF58_00295, partial [Xanthobacteraceae bacterium]